MHSQHTHYHYIHEQYKGILKVLFNLSDDEINLIFAKQTINNDNL